MSASEQRFQKTTLALSLSIIVKNEVMRGLS